MRVPVKPIASGILLMGLTSAFAQDDATNLWHRNDASSLRPRHESIAGSAARASARDRSLGAGDLRLRTRVDGDGVAQGACEGFERGLGLVVGVHAL